MQVTQNAYICLDNNAYKTRYTDIYVHLLSINFIYSVLLHGVVLYHQIAKSVLHSVESNTFLIIQCHVKTIL